MLHHPAQIVLSRRRALVDGAIFGTFDSPFGPTFQSWYQLNESGVGLLTLTRRGPTRTDRSCRVKHGRQMTAHAAFTVVVAAIRVFRGADAKGAGRLCV